MQINYKKYFDLLQLSPNASLEDVHEAYMLLSEEVNPKQYPNGSKKRKSEQKKLEDMDEAHDKLKELYASGYNPQEVPVVDFSESEIPTPPQMQELTNEQYLIASHPLFSSFLNRIFEFDETYQKLSHENLVTRPIKDAKVGTFSYQPISLLANIYSRTEPKPISREINGSQIDLPMVELTLSDSNGDQIKCLPIDFGKYSKKFGDLLYSRQVLRWVGFVIPIPNEGYYFYLKNIESNLNALDLIGLNPDVKKTALIRRVHKKMAKNPNGIRSCIKHILVKKLGISGLDQAIELDKAIDLMILQSFSFGKHSSDKFSNKLHSLVIGPPAVGKNLLTKIATILNPVAHELVSTRRKLTPAGLIGNATIKGKLTISNPGYLPLASGGIVCMQDFHDYLSRGGKDDFLMNTFSQVMEDGEVRDNTAARTVHKALTSIHLDMNRLSQVNPHKKYNGHEDIGIPTNILSRFDFIIEIPRDVDVQLLVSLDMIEKRKKSGNYNPNNFSTNDWARKLKVIVAYQTSYFRSISINQGVRKYKKKKLKELTKKYSSQEFASPYVFSDMLTRLANSIDKYAKAIACSECRTIILKKDVDEALSFIDFKLKFLFQDKSVRTKMNPIQERCDIIWGKFRGTSAKRKDIIDYVNSKASKPVRGKTIDRDLEVLEKEGKAKKVKQGLWRIDKLVDS
ncbi:minichromosome maintenance protein MCM [Candidatus Woesearchaeota archaeon]|nr:minichromosome maintenance protein MCM [Candidatus Woesearchaeota archaeon]